MCSVSVRSRCSGVEMSAQPLQCHRFQRSERQLTVQLGAKAQLASPINDFCNKIGHQRTSGVRVAMSAYPPKADMVRRHHQVCFVPIVLQKSKVAGLRIFRENTKREAIADLYNLIRVTEVAYEFNTRR